MNGNSEIVLPAWKAFVLSGIRTNTYMSTRSHTYTYMKLGYMMASTKTVNFAADYICDGVYLCFTEPY